MCDSKRLETAKKRTVAGIVAFHPDPSSLNALVAAISPDVSHVLVFANAPLERHVTQRLSATARGVPVEILGTGENVGLGRAYNCITEFAMRERSEFILLFDQDSLPPHGIVRHLEYIIDDLRTGGERPAVVAPSPVDRKGRRFRSPPRQWRGSHRLATPVQFVISSGSLIPLDALAKVGRFEDRFFIDAIDMEWCFRARDQGWSVWLGRHDKMVHDLGRGIISALGLRLTDQPAERIYTYFRNQTAMLRMRHIPVSWKARFVSTLPARIAIYALRHRFSVSVLKAMSLGLVDGAVNRLGAPDGRWRSIGGRRRRDDHDSDRLPHVSG
jgi:rhamnosyltransferase